MAPADDHSPVAEGEHDRAVAEAHASEETT
jgi:hypothetical protein